MDKLVNVYAKTAIRSVTPVICGTHKNVVMNTRDILKCICMRAVVEEVFEDGSTIVLTAKNYDKNNMPNTIDRAEEASDFVEVGDIIESEDTEEITSYSHELNDKTTEKATTHKPNNKGGKKKKNHKK